MLRNVRFASVAEVAPRELLLQDPLAEAGFARLGVASLLLFVVCVLVLCRHRDWRLTCTNKGSTCTHAQHDLPEDENTRKRTYITAAITAAAITAAAITASAPLRLCTAATVRRCDCAPLRLCAAAEVWLRAFRPMPMRWTPKCSLVAK